jgi:molybdenum cofactor biosynthesis enzyme MoaA
MDTSTDTPDRLSPGRIVRRITDPEVIDGELYWNCNIIEFEGRTYIFSHRAILTLVTISSCNAACKFCSNEITFTPHSPYLRPTDRLERVLRFASCAGVAKVAYTGGEPTANPRRLLTLVEAVSPRFRRSRLHTNGYGLLKMVESIDGEKPLIDALIAAGLTGVSVSVAHQDPDRNHDIMRHKGTWRGIADHDLEQIARRASDTFQPRLSCVLTEDGVRDTDDVRRYIEWGAALGYKRFIFRSCSGIPEEYRKATSYATYNASNAVNIDRIVDDLLSSSGVRETFAQHKSDSHVHTLALGDVSIDIDESSEEPDSDAKIRRLNVMPNQIAYTSWIDPLATLFPDDREQAMVAAAREGLMLEAHLPSAP